MTDSPYNWREVPRFKSALVILETGEGLKFSPDRLNLHPMTADALGALIDAARKSGRER